MLLSISKENVLALAFLDLYINQFDMSPNSEIQAALWPAISPLDLGMR